jgi:spore maturation protein CgeB
MAELDIVVAGLSITSSWGNGHATTYRGLVRELAARGHRVLFLERDVPWYGENRDLPKPPYCETALYNSVEELKDRFTRRVREADVVMVGSYVPDGVAVGEWVVSTAEGLTGFYDIDTPVTIAKLERGEYEYLTPELIARYDLYLSFASGRALRTIERRYGSPCARVLYCSVDPAAYYPEEREMTWDLGYLGTYGADRQPTLEKLLCEPARQWSQGRFMVAGPMYPQEIGWPRNVERVDHLPPAQHREFYNSQRFTLNVTRADMVRAGYSPSVRLFEAAACGAPVISDPWPGLRTIFRPGSEILTASTAAESLRVLRETSEKQRRAIGAAARRRVLAEHTAAHRAAELEGHVLALRAVSGAFVERGGFLRASRAFTNFHRRGAENA